MNTINITLRVVDSINRDDLEGRPAGFYVNGQNRHVYWDGFEIWENWFPTKALETQAMAKPFAGEMTAERFAADVADVCTNLQNTLLAAFAAGVALGRKENA